MAKMTFVNRRKQHIRVVVPEIFYRVLYSIRFSNDNFAAMSMNNGKEGMKKEDILTFDFLKYDTGVESLDIYPDTAAAPAEWYK